MSILTVFILVLTLAKGIKLQCTNCEIQLSNKSYTSLPIGQICQSFDAKGLIATNNSISSLRNLRNLRSARNATNLLLTIQHFERDLFGQIV